MTTYCVVSLSALPPSFFAPTSSASQDIKSPQQILEDDITHVFATTITPIAEELKKMRGSKETEEELNKKKKKREQKLKDVQQGRAVRERSRPRSYNVPRYGFPPSYSPRSYGGSRGWKSPYSYPSWGSSASNWNKPSSSSSSSDSPSSFFGGSSRGGGKGSKSSDSSSSADYEPDSGDKKNDKNKGGGGWKEPKNNTSAIKNKHRDLIKKLTELNKELNDSKNALTGKQLMNELPNVAHMIKDIDKELKKLDSKEKEELATSLRNEKKSLYTEFLKHLLKNTELVKKKNRERFNTLADDIKETLGKSTYQQMVDNEITQIYRKRFGHINFKSPANQPAKQEAENFLKKTADLILEATAVCDKLMPH